jgi:hypothetical protein
MRWIVRLSTMIVILGAVFMGGGAIAGAVGAAAAATPGDIPDTQAFVTFRSTTGGYALDVPEGWARAVQGTDVRFVNALDGLQVTVTNAAAAPTTGSAANEVAALRKQAPGVRIMTVTNVRLPAGPAVLVQYTSNSERDPVTGKRAALENQAFLLHKNGKRAALMLWAPLGADNSDQWQRIARSFRWL